MTTILCIEDESDIRQLIAEELSDIGFDILEAANGREGLEVLIAQRPDLVVCDISMPVMDGHQLLAEIQLNHPELAQIPFIFLTALTDMNTLVASMEGGAVDHLTKPIDFDVLIAKVQRHVDRLDAGQQRRFGHSG
jgi:CheY-like chemotaxis protein